MHEMDYMVVVVESHYEQVLCRDSGNKPFTVESATELAIKLNVGMKPEFSHSAQVGQVRIISDL